MNMTNLIKRPIAYTMISFMVLIGFQAPAMADIVDTQDLTMQVELQMQRDNVRDLMAREDVRAAFSGYGVSASDIDARIDNLTSSELLMVQEKMADLPAGGSVIGAVVGIILIFVLLDLLGATDVFPRI